MAGSAGARLAEAFAAARPSARIGPETEAELEGALAMAAKAWPELALDPQRFPQHFVAALARVVGDDVTVGLAGMFVEDFALATACAAGVPGALGACDRLCAGAIAAAVARVDPRPELLDEARQILWQRMFAGSIDHPARIRTYAGRGPLAGWMAVAAQRIAIDLGRQAARQAADPLPDEILRQDDHPEADYLRTRYKVEFEAAVGKALAALPDRDRLLLRLTIVGGLAHEQVAAIYRVNQSTVSRWIARARAEVWDATAREVCERLGLPRDEFRSLAAVVVSGLDLSISRVLASSSDAGP